ncbi:MAG: putative lipopolysaccharide heptosyltransferase III [Gammaproteobacteria bacterium]|nr:putative lipopolysaccharide heptosyltransferase III [Gammaproteobacteria bacterium]
MSAEPIQLAACRRALIIKLRHHGDVLLTAPVFAVLKALKPDLEVDALTYQDSLELLSLNPDIAQIHVIDRGDRHRAPFTQMARAWQLLRTLRGRRYDLIIHLTEHPRGAWLARLLRPRYAVARRYPGRRGRWWRGSFTHLYDVPARQRHTVETHLDALRRLGLTLPAQRPLRLVAGADADRRVYQRLATLGLAAKEFLVVHPTSRWLFKCWPETHMARLLDDLGEQGLRIVVTAGPAADERAWIARLRALAKRPLIDLSGQLSLKELAALIGRARLFIGVDSAPMHMAAAMGTPVVAFFGPSGDEEWAPWQVPSRVLVAPFSCRPCGLAGCGDGQVSECLAHIGVEQAAQAVAALLAETASPCASS